MTSKDRVSDINTLSEDDVLTPILNQRVEGILDSGGHFYGILEGFSEFQLFLKGDHNQRIIIKRRKVAWMEAI